MRLVFKSQVRDDLWHLIRDAKSIGKEIERIEITAEEYMELSDIRQPGGCGTETLLGYPYKVVKNHKEL